MPITLTFILLILLLGTVVLEVLLYLEFYKIKKEVEWIDYNQQHLSKTVHNTMYSVIQLKKELDKKEQPK